jgi:hypothetical protein
MTPAAGAGEFFLLFIFGDGQRPHERDAYFPHFKPLAIAGYSIYISHRARQGRSGTVTVSSAADGH